MQLEVGSIVEGKVTGITKFGALVELEPNVTGMVHISEVASTYVKEIRDHVSENQMIKVKVLAISEDGKISLSMKRAVEAPKPRPEKRPYSPRPDNTHKAKSSENMSFEEMLSKFKQTSDEKMNDIKRGMDSKRGGFSRRSGNQW